MEIDLDNLVFNGLDEAEERNAERLDDADKKAQAIVADDDCGDACRSNKKAPGSRCFLFHSLHVTHTSFQYVSRMRRSSA